MLDFWIHGQAEGVTRRLSEDGVSSAPTELFVCVETRLDKTYALPVFIRQREVNRLAVGAGHSS
jgi:hypothetical protein